MTGTVAIVGLGAVTSLGVDALSSCAAARAGLSQPRTLEPFLVIDPETGNMEPLVGHPVSFLTDGFTGVARASRLGALALRDLVKRQVLTASDMADTALVLTLGSGYYFDTALAIEEAETEDGALVATLTPISEATAVRRAGFEANLVRRMFEQAELPMPAQHTLVFEDQAGGMMALAHGVEALARGRVRRCLVGGIDSYCEPAMLDALDSLELLKTPQNPVGFAPGEAGVFVLLQRTGSGPAVPAVVPAESIVFAAGGKHQFSPDTRSCRYLADTIRRAFSCRERAAGSVWTVGTHNGTSWAGSEWGHALTLLPRPIANGEHWYPAIGFGETGAAAGLLALCVAVRAFERGYSPAETALVWASSPRGTKAALCVMRG